LSHFKVSFLKSVQIHAAAAHLYLFLPGQVHPPGRLPVTYSKIINIPSIPVIIRLAWTYRPNVHKSAGIAVLIRVIRCRCVFPLLDRWWQWRSKHKQSVHPSSA
jgi:hypothetical protein